MAIHGGCGGEGDAPVVRAAYVGGDEVAKRKVAGGGDDGVCSDDDAEGDADRGGLARWRRVLQLA